MRDRGITESIPDWKHLRQPQLPERNTHWACLDPFAVALVMVDKYAMR